jgi:ribosome-associated protein
MLPLSNALLICIGTPGRRDRKGGQAMAEIAVAPGLTIDERDLDFQFVRASGPGGQNVNKVATAAQLRFDTSGLPEAVRRRLPAIAGRRLTEDGVLVIDARRFRTQLRNRADAVERLVELLRRATVAPKYRRPTRPSRAAKAKRVETKKKRGATKALRGKPAGGE